MLTVNSEADITGAANAKLNSIAIATANSDTSLSVAGLEAGVYKLYTVDATGNLSAKADTPWWSPTPPTPISLT